MRYNVQTNVVNESQYNLYDLCATSVLVVNRVFAAVFSLSARPRPREYPAHTISTHCTGWVLHTDVASAWMIILQCYLNICIMIYMYIGILCRWRDSGVLHHVGRCTCNKKKKMIFEAWPSILCRYLPISDDCAL